MHKSTLHSVWVSTSIKMKIFLFKKIWSFNKLNMEIYGKWPLLISELKISIIHFFLLKRCIKWSQQYWAAGTLSLAAYLRDHRSGHLSWAVVLLMVGVVVLCGVVWCGVVWCDALIIYILTRSYHRSNWMFKCIFDDWLLSQLFSSFEKNHL